MQNGINLQPYLASAETTDTPDETDDATSDSISIPAVVPPDSLNQFDSQFPDDDERLVLNVGGVRHETHLATLLKVPNSRLYSLAELHIHGSKKDIYFFDRHPAVFNSVIDFYRTGELHVPLEVCGAVVKRELDYWRINEKRIQSCCWRTYRTYIENKRILESFNRSILKEQMQHVDITDLKGWNRIQNQIWLLLEFPRTSRAAMTYGIISLLFVIASILGFCLETLPQLRPQNVTLPGNVTSKCKDSNSTVGYTLKPNPALNILDTICTAFFTMELVVRFFFAPNKFKFVRTAMNILDLLALVPLYMQFLLNNDNFCLVNERLIFEIMFILRIIRMFRIFHLVKHYQALNILVYALKASVQELLMLGIFLFIGMLVFATMIYYAERKDAVNPSDVFNTIPIGFWWALITMTTVGYGDVYPSTPIGYCVGAGCAVAGVLLVALTIPVISNNFTLFYTHVRSQPSTGSDDEDSMGSDGMFDGAKIYENTRRTSNGSVIMNERSFTITRKPSNSSAVTETITNRNAFYNGDIRSTRRVHPDPRYNMDANSMNNVAIKRDPSSEYHFSRSPSVKARSDDGVQYSGAEAVL